jgi:hypothetical protein
MMGLVFNRQNIYRVFTTKLDRDSDNSYDLQETVVPGGDYLRPWKTAPPCAERQATGADIKRSARCAGRTRAGRVRP